MNLNKKTKIESLKSALKKKSFAVAIKISVGLFIFLSLFLFYVQIHQKRIAIEDKVKIDRDLLVGSLKIGDLFFITKYVSSIVDSQVAPFAGIRDAVSGEWIFSFPTELTTFGDLHTAKFSLAKSQILVPVALNPQDNMNWTFYYILEVSHRFLLNAFLIAVSVCALIFIFLRVTLTSTSHYFIAPLANLMSDLQSQGEFTSGSLNTKNYEQGHKFTETNLLVDSLKGLIEKIEEQQKEIQKVEILKVLHRMSRQVSHDIQSPIGALKAAVQNLESNPQASKNLITKAMSRIDEIVLDLKVDDPAKQNTKSEMTETDMENFISDVVADKKSEYSNRDVVIDLVFENKVPVRYIHRGRFARVLSNLINNGIEAAAEPPAQIKIEVAHIDSKTTIVVSDNGRGISKDVQERIFDYGFTHGKSGGSGMGLSYAKQVMIDHEGTICLENRSGFKTSIRLDF